MEKTTLPFMPHDLIVQILQRLPVKSLLRFKCVCKSWFSLISHDSHFADSQFQLSAATHTPTILFISTPDLEARFFDFEASLHDYSTSPSLNLHFLIPKSYSLFQIKGSCRGFVLFYYSSNFSGFGYDHSTNDYLLVSMSYDKIPNSDDMLSHVWLFSFRDNAWKEIASTTHFPFYTYASVVNPNGYLLFNGAIHWFALRHDILFCVIVAFHLRQRILLEIPLPVDFDHDFIDCGLWVFRGFLSLWVFGDGTLDIWVMKEYKVGSSWTKTLVFPIEDIPYFLPLSSAKNGDIIGTDGGTGLVKYNNKGEFLEQKSYEHGFRLTTMYTESLLSLPNDREQA